MRLGRYLTGVILLVGLAPVRARADEPSLESRFTDVVKPFLRRYCLDCHGERKKEAKLDLSVYSSAARVVEGAPGLGACVGAARGGGDAARKRRSGSRCRTSAAR